MEADTRLFTGRDRIARLIGSETRAKYHIIEDNSCTKNIVLEVLELKRQNVRC